jgi:hypothetical protein
MCRHVHVPDDVSGNAPRRFSPSGAQDARILQKFELYGIFLVTQFTKKAGADRSAPAGIVR